MKRWADHFWTEEAIPQMSKLEQKSSHPTVTAPGMALFSGDTRHAVCNHHHEDKITYVPQWPRQAYFRSYLQNCSNKYCLLAQRLTEVRYLPRRHQPPREAEMLGRCAFAKNASKWLPQQVITPACTSHRKTHPGFASLWGGGRLGLVNRLSRGVKRLQCFLQHPLRASCSVKASSPLTLRA